MRIPFPKLLEIAVEVVCEEHGVSAAEVLGKSRKRVLAEARQEAGYLLTIGKAMDSEIERAFNVTRWMPGKWFDRVVERSDSYAEYSQRIGRMCSAFITRVKEEEGKCATE